MLSRTNSQYCVITSWYLLTVLSTIMVISLVLLFRFTTGTLFLLVIAIAMMSFQVPYSKFSAKWNAPLGLPLAPITNLGPVVQLYKILLVCFECDRQEVYPTPSKFYCKRASPFKIFSLFPRRIHKTNSADLGKVPLAFQVMNIGLLNICATNISLLSYKFT